MDISLDIIVTGITFFNRGQHSYAGNRVSDFLFKPKKEVTFSDVFKHYIK